MIQNQIITVDDYQQLIPGKRGKIAALLGQGNSLSSIAVITHRSPSMISREVQCSSVRQISSNHQTAPML